MRKEAWREGGRRRRGGWREGEMEKGGLEGGRDEERGKRRREGGKDGWMEARRMERRGGIKKNNLNRDITWLEEKC